MALSSGLSIAVALLIKLILNYTQAEHEEPRVRKHYRLVLSDMVISGFQRKESNDVLPPESPIAAGTNAVGFQHSRIAPPSHCVDVDVEKMSHFSYC